MPMRGVSEDAIHPDSLDRGGWSWSEPRHGEHFRRCSWCGSVHPVDLSAEPDLKPDWADRKYGWPHKFYVSIKNRDPERLFVTGTANYRPDYGSGDWVAGAALSDEQRLIAARDGYNVEATTAFLSFGTRSMHYGKFYTVHLADPALDAATKEAIARMSGLRFTFIRGRVEWRGYDYAGTSTPAD
jgi:hypothetical protein